MSELNAGWAEFDSSEEIEIISTPEQDAANARRRADPAEQAREAARNKALGRAWRRREAAGEDIGADIPF